MCFLEKWGELDTVCVSVCERESRGDNRGARWEREALQGVYGLRMHLQSCMSEIAPQKEAQQIQINIIIKSVINTKASIA